MDVFICWSGAASHVLAEGLRQWLPRVIQASRPFLSSEDIRKGQRWNEQITARLEKSNFAILCMTPENLQAPWIHFEAGAVSKYPGISHVSALLVDVKASDLGDPLKQFQHTLPTKEDVWKLAEAVNAAMEPDRQTTPESLEWSFGQAWPDFEALLQRARETLKAGPTPSPPRRDEKELLEELLTLVRGLQRAHETDEEGLRRRIELATLQDALLLREQELALLRATRAGGSPPRGRPITVPATESSETPLVLREAPPTDPK